MTRTSFVRSSLAAMVVAAAFPGFGLFPVDATAQEVARTATPVPAPALQPARAPEAPLPSVDTSTEAAALAHLAARLATRRSELDGRRQALAREHDLISAVEQPAGEAEIALWRERNATGDRLERDLEDLRALIRVLTPEALRSVSLPEGSTGPALKPDAGLLRTSLEVNLRDAPESPPFATLEADTVVARLATDAAGG